MLALQSFIQELVVFPSVPAFLWQRVLGLLASLLVLVPYCRHLLRPLQLPLPSILKCSSVGLSFVVVSADSSNQGSMCSWASPARFLIG